MTIPDPYQSALHHHRSGNLREAEVLYRQILAANPRHADALHMLGLLASQVDRNDIAAQLLEQALALAPNSTALLTELAEIHRRLNHLEQAAALCHRALALDPNCFDAHYNLAVILQQQGSPSQLNDAIAEYHKALQLNPNHPESHHNLANASKAQNQIHQALDHYHLAIALRPAFPEALGNLGLLFYESHNLPSAVTAFNAVIAITPNDPVAHNSLANALRDQGHTEAAINAYQRAIQLNPNYSVAHNNLGKILHDAGRLQDALPHYRRAIAAAPDRAEPYQNLGMALEKLGENREALEMYKAALARGVSSAEARYHMLAATGGGAGTGAAGLDPPTSAPASHVVHLFDQFADKFDEHLEKLHYQTPQLLLAAIQKTNPAKNSLDILDLGCGTGLCAPLFKHLARSLLGVDLSPNMIEKARQKNLYSHLFVDDIVNALRARPNAFDLLLAADVLVYLGDLAPLFTAASTALRSNAHFAFSVETGPCETYLLRPTRRFIHSEKYLRHLAAHHHFQILSLTPATLREEASHPVPGLIALLKSDPAKQNP